MQKTFCDRCKNEVKPDQTVDVVSVNLAMNGKKASLIPYNIKNTRLELCGGCLDKLGFSEYLKRAKEAPHTEKDIIIDLVEELISEITERVSENLSHG